MSDRSSPLPALYELESEIMEALWARGEATVRAVHDALDAESDRTRAYTTIMTTMQRLDAKGFLGRRREGRSDIFAASVSRDSYHQARVASEIEGLVEQYGELALTNFARTMASLDPARRRQLARLARRG